MKKLISIASPVFALLLAACGSKGGGPAPAISEFTIASPVAATASTISGSVYVADPAGLTDLMADLVITGPLSTTLSVPVSGGGVAVTGAMVPLELILGSAIPAGTYQVSITMSEGGETSNSLATTVVVQ